MRRPPRHVVLVAAAVATLGVLVPVARLGGVATAAGAPAVLLGRSNVARSATTLGNPVGTPLRLHAARGSAPLVVDSEHTVRHLDADLLDGLHASALQRRITGSCRPGTTVTSVAPTGALGCAREPFSVVWQVLVRPDGVPDVGHPGVTVLRSAPGDYTLGWGGFPGRALPYCTGIGRSAVLVSLATRADGTGSARLAFDAADTGFSCALVATG